MESLVPEDTREHRLSLVIARDRLSIGVEAVRGGSFRQVQEGQQRRVPVALHADVVEPALPGGEPVRLPAGGAAVLAQQLDAAAAEQVGVALLVEGMTCASASGSPPA